MRGLVNIKKYEEEYRLLKSKCLEQLNTHWKSYVESKTLELTFSQLPEVTNFFTNVIWIDGSFETLHEAEKSTIIFVLPGKDNPIQIVIENYSYDFTMYLYMDGQFTTFQSLFKIRNTESIIWKYLWDFDIFSYLYDLQKLKEEFNTNNQ